MSPQWCLQYQHYMVVYVCRLGAPFPSRDFSGGRCFLAVTVFRPSQYAFVRHILHAALHAAFPSAFPSRGHCFSARSVCVRLGIASVRFFRGRYSWMCVCVSLHISIRLLLFSRSLFLDVCMCVARRLLAAPHDGCWLIPPFCGVTATDASILRCCGH